MRTIVDLITTKLRISLTWRKSKSTQRKRSRRKKKRKEKKKIRNRRFLVLKRLRRSRKLRLQIASASEMKSLMKRKKKMMFLRNLLILMKRVKIMWDFRLLFFFCSCFSLIQIEFHLSVLDSIWPRVCALNDDNQRDMCITRSY